MNDWLSKEEQAQKTLRRVTDHVLGERQPETPEERIARVIRELAGYILISHRSNDPIEISLAYHNLSPDAKELLK